MSKPLKDTEEQSAIIKGFLSGQNMIIQAYAGCGKTATQVKIAKAYSDNIDNKTKKLAVAFNKRAKAELEERLHGYSDWVVKTFNGLGHGVLMQNPRQWNKGNLTVDMHKCENLINDLMHRLSESDKTVSEAALRGSSPAQLKRILETSFPNTDKFREYLLASVEACKTFGIRPGGFGQKDMLDKQITSESTLANLYSDVKYMDMIPEGNIDRLVNNVLNANLMMAQREGIIDYNDQIYLSVLFCENKGRQWPIGLLDEVQDMSKLNIQQIERSVSGQVVAVGDFFQNLYQFRGSYDGNMDDIADIWQCVPYTLSSTFRCPPAIVERAKAVIEVNDFKSFNETNPGTVQAPFISQHKNQKLGWSMNDIVRAHMVRNDKNPSHRTAIVTRTNNACQVILGLLLVSKLVQDGDFPLENIGWSSNPINAAQATRGNTPTKLLADICMAHDARLMDVVGGKRLKEPELGEENYNFVVTTVHRCKGLEYDDVYIYNPDDMLSFTNVYYVAQTRTKDRLALLYPNLILQSWPEELKRSFANTFGWDEKFVPGVAMAELMTLWASEKHSLFKKNEFFDVRHQEPLIATVNNQVRRAARLKTTALSTRVSLDNHDTIQPLLRAPHYAPEAQAVDKQAPKPAENPDLASLFKTA